jgi:hypothetical protein
MNLLNMLRTAATLLPVLFVACTSSESAWESMSKPSASKSCACDQSTACDSNGTLRLTSGVVSVEASALPAPSLELMPGDTLALEASTSLPVCGYLTKLSLNVDLPEHCWNITDFTRTNRYQLSKTVVIPPNAKPGNYAAMLMISTSEPSRGTYQQHRWLSIGYTVVSDTN